MKRIWVKDPHAGGIKIPEAVKRRARERIERVARERHAGKFMRLDVRFRGHFCYIDAFLEPDVPEDFDEVLFGQTREERIEELKNTPMHLCRLRYQGDEDQWSLDFYCYSNNKYQPSVFDHGGFYGTPEEALNTSAFFLE